MAHGNKGDIYFDLISCHFYIHDGTQWVRLMPDPPEDKTIAYIKEKTTPAGRDRSSLILTLQQIRSQPEAKVMRLLYDSPNVGFGVETEIPCEADPIPFALKLIEQVRERHKGELDDDIELHYCYADGAPLR